MSLAISPQLSYRWRQNYYYYSQSSARQHSIRLANFVRAKVAETTALATVQDHKVFLHRFTDAHDAIESHFDQVGDYLDAAFDYFRRQRQKKLVKWNQAVRQE